MRSLILQAGLGTLICLDCLGPKELLNSQVCAHCVGKHHPVSPWWKHPERRKIACKKISKANTGVKRSPECKEKISIGTPAQNAWRKQFAELARERKGKTYEELYGEQKAQLVRQRKLTTFLANCQNRKPSKIEKRIATLLDKMGERYVPQHIVGIWLADFYLPEHNVVIECDGEYWHSLPGRDVADALKDIVYDSVGLKVLRLKEEDIRERLNVCEKLIREKIAEPIVQLYKIGALFDRYIIDLIRHDMTRQACSRGRKVEFALMNYLKVRKYDCKQLLGMIKDLANIHELLWSAEDEIRKPTLSIVEKGELGSRIGKLNDLRMDVQGQIDGFFGFQIEKKFYK